MPRPSSAELRTVKLLTDVSERVLEELSCRCSWRRFQPGQRIVSRDARDDDVYLIISGTVRVTAFSGGGRQIIYRDLHEGEWFGDLAAIDHFLRSADVVATCETVLASLPPADFIRLLSENNTASDAQIKHLVDWVRELTDRLFDLSTLSVQHRVHTQLVNYAKQAGIVNNVARIDPAPRHADIASQVSTYREQVTRALSRLSRLGILERKGTALIVRDVARLERMVDDVRRIS